MVFYNLREKGISLFSFFIFVILFLPLISSAQDIKIGIDSNPQPIINDNSSTGLNIGIDTGKNILYHYGGNASGGSTTNNYYNITNTTNYNVNYTNIALTNQSATWTAGTNVSTSNNGWFFGLFNWIISSLTSSSHATFNGTTLFINDTYFYNQSATPYFYNMTLENTTYHYNQTIPAIDYSNANFYNKSANIEMGFYNLTVNGTVTIINTKNATVILNNFVEHTQEMMTDTLIDKSRSTLSVVGGVLNYTLFAYYGCSQFNFGGVIYPKDHSCVNNATITLLNGSDLNPATNYIYWELVADVPTMKTASTYPATTHIDVATFIVGSVSGSTANVYSYSRNRYEVDSFVKRSLERIEESGTLYKSGFNPTATTTILNITSGGKFFNNIFEMTSTNDVKLSEGFYYINGSSNFKIGTDLTPFIAYANGVPFSGGVNERINIVWGLVPVNTTGGTGPTQMRLVAVLPNEPTVKYNTVAEAIADVYETTNYYPPNNEIKKVFVPIVRTIMKPSGDVFEPFSTGNYYQDIRGKITTGGGAGVSTDTSGLVPYSNSNQNVNLGGYNFSVNNSVLFVNAHTGKVGIGTTAPAYLLETAVSPIGANLSGVLYVNGTSGKVGIGTSSPSSALDVVGNIEGSQIQIDTTGTLSTYAAGVIGSGCTAGNNGAFAGGRLAANYGTNGFYWNSKNGAAATNYNNFSSGFSTTAFFVETANGNIPSISGIYLGGSVGIKTAQPAYILETAVSAIGANFSGTLYVNGTNSRVGINTTAPGFPLTVDGKIGVTNNNGVYFLTTGNLDDGTSMKRTTANATLFVYSKNSLIFQANGDNDVRFWNSTGLAYVTYEADNRRVGIRTTSPAQPLHVNGSALIVNQIGINGQDVNANYGIVSSGISGAILGYNDDNAQYGILGYQAGALNYAVYGTDISNEGYAGYFYGQVYVSLNVSAQGFIDRTSVFNTDKNAFDYVKDASYYLDNGVINHSRFYGYTTFNNPQIDYSRPETKIEQNCTTTIIDVDGDTKETCKPVTITYYPHSKDVTEEGVDLGREISVHRQAIYEIKTENDKLTNCIATSKTFDEMKLCAGGSG